jgi:PAS domain S-box-containing protein
MPLPPDHSEKPPAPPLPTPYDFAMVFDHAGLGMVIADEQGRILHANEAYAALVGRTAQSLVGRDSSEFTHPDDRDLTRLSVERVERHGTTVLKLEKRYLRPDGSVVWVRATISPGFDEKHGHYLIGTAEDITEQKVTREELIETRRRLSSALIAGEVATYEWDMSSDRLWGDANFDRIFGTQRDADGTAPLARFVEAIHPDDRDRVLAAVNRTVSTGEEYDVEYRVNNEGVERWVSARGRISSDGPGTLTRFHGVVLDISARKRAQQELQRRTRLYDTFLSGTDDLAYLIDREGRFIFANRALLALWGMTMEEVNGKTLYDLGYPKWHADMNMREFAEILETKKGLTGEVPYTSPTGVNGLYEYVFSPVLDEHGEVEVIAGTSRDVTERRHAAETQKRLADQLKLALEAAHMGWWQFDLNTGRVTWDERTRSIFGLHGGEGSYDAVRSQIFPEDAATIDQAIREAADVNNPKPFLVEYRVRGRDGDVRWVVSRALCIFEGEGPSRRPVRLVGTALDVTETKVAQEALQALLESERAARTEAEHASRMKEEFLATLSHELRTPLAAILGWAQILGAGGMSDDEAREGIGVIERNARAQAQIIEDLLEMSRVVSGKVRLEIQDVKLTEVVAAAVATVRTAASARGVSISIATDASDPEISGDMNRLQQVFWNLLSNAVKFTPPGGRIDVSIAQSASDVMISVRDTGEGIAADFLPFVFDRFRQADATTTRRHGGLGLGLAIVKQLVELHGGSVRAESAGLGMGSTFQVLLPAGVRVSDVQPVELPRRVRTYSGIVGEMHDRLAGLRILLVDDENDTREVVSRFLEECDVSVRQASSAEEALQLLAAESYDVLLSDIGMPLEDGYSMIGRVRAAGNAIPAVALTAYARPDDRARALSSGFNAHVAKPLDLRELTAAVTAVAGRT